MMPSCYLTSTFSPALTKRRRPIAGVHPMERPAAKRLRARMAHTLHAFFMRQAPKIIGQVVVLRGKQPFVKAELSQDELDQIDKIVAGIDFAGWAILAGDVDDILAEMVKDGSVAGFAEVALDVTARPEILNIVNQDALDYAADRSAAMVGMRRLADGSLIENPNADWQITEPTRDMIRGDVTQALQEGWTNDRLASKLVDSYAFSDQRAMVIARTETIRASNAGALSSYRAADVQEKEWTTAEDDRVSEDCEANGDQGPIGIDENFASGDDAPPAHPNCRCVIVPVVHFASEQTTPTPEKEEA